MSGQDPSSLGELWLKGERTAGGSPHRPPLHWPLRLAERYRACWQVHSAKEMRHSISSWTAGSAGWSSVLCTKKGYGFHPQSGKAWEATDRCCSVSKSVNISSGEEQEKKDSTSGPCYQNSVPVSLIESMRDEAPLCSRAAVGPNAVTAWTPPLPAAGEGAREGAVLPAQGHASRGGKTRCPDRVANHPRAAMRCEGRGGVVLQAPTLSSHVLPSLRRQVVSEGGKLRPLCQMLPSPIL